MGTRHLILCLFRLLIIKCRVPIIAKCSVPIIILLFMAITPCYSAPCYGSRLPKTNQWFAGAQTHIIFDRNLEAAWGEVRSQQHFLLLSYGICDWLSLDLKGAAGNIKQHPGSGDELDYPSSFAGGYGLRGKLYDADKLDVVLGFQHISVHPRSIRIEGVKNQAILDDWQVSLLISYAYQAVTPYLGLKWSRLDYIHWVEERRKRRMSDASRDIGLFLGCDISLSDRVWLNLEGQLFDGEAASLSLNLAF